MIQRVVATFFFLCFVLKISAQLSDSALSLNPVEIKAEKISVFTTGLKIDKIDETTLFIRQGTSLAALLAEQSPITLRSYGPGGISTLTMRGTNSSQSGVFWNGINLQQPNMGMTDLSRISTFDFSDISIQSGGASALLGSGVIGGSLHLANTMKFASPLKCAVLSDVSSIGNYTGGLKASAGNSRLAYTGSLSADWNKNNFRYDNLSGQRERLEHALVKSVSTIHQLEYIINPRQRITSGFWYQSTARQIPPSLTMAGSDQQQADDAIRSTLQWTYSGTKQMITVRTAFIKETEHFQSVSSSIDALYQLNTLQADMEYKRSLSNLFTFGSGITGRMINADVSYYNRNVSQPEGAAWLALVYTTQGRKITAAFNLRQDFSKGYKIPVCPAINTSFSLSKTITANFNVSGNFRVPTLNDKYWIPGGNPDIKPEASWNMEAGFEFKMHTGDLLQSKINVTAYNLLIDNMIQWVPVSAALWSPLNVQKVWSRGIEVTSLSNWKYAGFSGYFRFGYIYSPSTYKESVQAQSNIIGKQLIYIPLHKVQETFYIAKDAFYTLFSFSLSGKRYVQSDNAMWLPSYTLFDFYFGTMLPVKKLNIRLQAAIRNVLNVEYQSVQYYPEPGRTFSISVLISK